MPLITFSVTGAAVSSRLEHGKADWHVTLHFALPFDEHLTLATGEDVRTIRLALTIKAMTLEHDRWLQERQGKPDQPVIGQMHYFDGPSAILSDAHIPADAFERILGLVQAGRVPNSVTVEVQRLDYDWRPDGSGKVWDNRANPIVPVTNISFDVPVAGLSNEGGPDRMSELAKLSARIDHASKMDAWRINCSSRRARVRTLDRKDASRRPMPVLCGQTKKAKGLGHKCLTPLLLLAFRWCRRGESNPRPQPYQGCALPLSYGGEI